MISGFVVIRNICINIYSVHKEAKNITFSTTTLVDCNVMKTFTEVLYIKKTYIIKQIGSTVQFYFLLLWTYYKTI